MHFRKTWEPFKSPVQKCRRIPPGSKAVLGVGSARFTPPPRDSQCNLPTTTYYPLGIYVYILSIGTDASKADPWLRITSLRKNSIGHAWLAFHPLFCHSSIPQGCFPLKGGVDFKNLRGSRSLCSLHIGVGRNLAKGSAGFHCRRSKFISKERMFSLFFVELYSSQLR